MNEKKVEQPTGDLTDEQIEFPTMADAQLWMTHESRLRLASGGNGKGAVPVHGKRSATAVVPLYTAADMRQFARAAIAAHIERQAQAVRIPQSADEVIAFIGSQFESREDADNPENVRFQLTVHDLQSAFRWWFDTDFADPSAAAPDAKQVQHAEREVQDDDANEGLQLLDDLIANIEKGGNYSKGTTLTFLGQIRQCFAVPASQEGAHAARNEKGGAA